MFSGRSQLPSSPDRGRPTRLPGPYIADASRARLEDLLGRHRNGLNPKRGEHFGTALAECVAARMVPFAHDSDGQREVVDGAADRLFDSVPEAFDLVVDAGESGATPRLPADRFAADRFHRKLGELVAERLA